MWGGQSVQEGGGITAECVVLGNKERHGRTPVQAVLLRRWRVRRVYVRNKNVDWVWIFAVDSGDPETWPCGSIVAKDSWNLGRWGRCEIGDTVLL